MGSLFHCLFDLYLYYIDTFNILPNDIWNLGEAVFKIEEFTKKKKVGLAPNDAVHPISHDFSVLLIA